MGATGPVLVIEGDPEVREVLAEHLTLHGFVVLEAATGAEAWHQLRHHRPRAIVMGLNSARVGGLETLRRLRAAAPGLPLLVVTDAGDDEVCWRALELGARDVLTGPVVPADVVHALEETASAGETPGSGAAHAPRGAGTPPAVLRVVGIGDDPELRAAVEGACARPDRRGCVLPDAPETVTALVDRAPDVVLLNIRGVAGLGSFEALATVRTLVPEATVILTGAVTDAPLARRAFARGAFDFLPGPLDARALDEALEAAAELRRLAG
jgi:DNA-binding response OmpR family regulator